MSKIVSKHRIFLIASALLLIVFALFSIKLKKNLSIVTSSGKSTDPIPFFGSLNDVQKDTEQTPKTSEESNMEATPIIEIADKTQFPDTHPTKLDNPKQQHLIHRVISEKWIGNKAVNGKPARQRIRIVETDFKYSMLRLEEDVTNDPKTGEEISKIRSSSVADHLIVGLKDKADVDKASKLLEKDGYKIRGVEKDSFLLVEINQFENSDDQVASINRLLGIDEFVNFAEPDWIVQTSVTPNDPAFTGGKAWSYDNPGTIAGTLYDADIDGPDGWDQRNNASSVVVAVTDTGIRYTHEDLASNMWDDGSGIHGWDAYSEDTDPMDTNGHGTHVAGIIGARGNNGLGTTGVAWSVQLMALRFIGPNGGTTSDAIRVINYARLNGAHIINASWGGGGYSEGLANAIKACYAADIPVVAAAGNYSRNNDSIIHYPSGYHTPNVVAVASSDANDTLSFFSNYGNVFVDLAAPGADIWSCGIASDSDYRHLSGTSMAAPHVAGALALAKARYPGESSADLITRLYTSVDTRPSLNRKVATGGRLNLYRLLADSSPSYLHDDFEKPYWFFGCYGYWCYSNGRMTREADEDVFSPDTGQKSMWFRWTAPSDGLVRFKGQASIEDVSVVAFEGADRTSLKRIADNFKQRPTKASYLYFYAKAGRTYTFSVDSRSATAQIIIGELVHHPINDMWRDATNLGSTNRIEVTGNNCGATAESWENVTPPAAGAGNGRSVWWKWTPNFSGDFTLSTQSSPIDTVLAVYTGTSPSALTEVASNDDRSAIDWTSEVNFSVVSGTTYYILVDSARGAWVGDIVLNGYVPGSLFILKQPESKLVRIGDAATIQVAAAGQGLRYQWEFNGVPIPGAVQPHYNILRIIEEDLGDYRVSVSDISSTIVSNVATLSELQLSPQIIWQTNSRSVSLGSSLDLRIRATGTPPLLYKWFKNGIEIPGATTDQITLNNVDATAAANYTATVNNSSGFTTTDPIVLKVFSSPWNGWNYIDPTSQAGSVFSIIKHEGQWVAASRSPNSIRISTSTDGKNWNHNFITPDGNNTGLSGVQLIRGNGFWLCTASASNPNKLVFKSTDLQNWTQHTIPIPFSDSLHKTIFYEGYFYLSTYNSLYRSTDAVNWVIQQTPIGENIRCGIFVTDGGSRLLTTSSDHKFVYLLNSSTATWQKTQVDPTSIYSVSLSDVNPAYWHNNKFYVYLSSNRYESTDGITWIRSLSTPSPEIQRDASWILNIGSTSYAYVNNGAQLYASSDAGLTWRSYLNSVPERMTLAASDGNQMIFGTELGGLLATNNPLTANFPIKTFGDSFVGVGYEGGLFIAQFWKNTMISSDGERWSTYPSVRIDSDPFLSPQPTVPSKIGDEFWQIGYPSSSNPFIPFYRGKLPSVVQFGQIPNSPNVALTSFCEGSQGIFAMQITYQAQGGQLAKSTNQGASWTPVTSPIGNISQYSKVFYTGSHYFYDVYLGNTYASADLVNWIDLGPTTEIIFHENEYWVFNGAGSRRTQNFVNWTPLVSMPNPGIYNLISYNGALVGLQNSVVSYSYDAVNWVPMNIGFAVSDIAASGHVLLAGGSGGQLAYTGSAPEISPTVNIREPFEDTSYLTGTVIPVKVDAHSPDKTGDPVVRLYYDGILQDQKASPPYEFDLPVGSAAKHLIHVECQNGSGPLAYARKRIIVTNPAAINLFTGYDNNSSLTGETVYRKGIFISRSNTGIRTSTDGLNWSPASLPTTVGSLKSFVEGSDRILAYNGFPADTNAAITLDGVNWIGVKLPNAPGFEIRYSHGVFWTATPTSGTNPGFMTSPDGINWTIRKYSIQPGSLKDICGNPFGTILGRADTTLQRSTDGGRSWTSISTFIFVNSLWSDGRRFYINEGNGSTRRVGSSLDGINWVWSPLDGRNAAVRLVNGTTFVADTANKIYSLSYDGINWQTVNHDLYADSIIWGEDGFFYARGPNPSFGGYANLMRSPNGLDWYVWASWPLSWPTTEQVSFFSAESGLFVSSISGGLWQLPYNSKTWTTSYLPVATSPIFMDVAKNGNALIAINNSKSLMRSVNDGQTWTTVYSLTVQEANTHILRDIFALGGVWLAWSPGTRLLRSVDGLVFTDVTTATGSNNFKALAHNSNNFTAIRGDGAVMTSTDGLNWSQLAAAGSFPDDTALKLVHNGTEWRALSVKSTATSLLNYSSSATGETWNQVQIPGSHSSGTAIIATNSIGTIAGRSTYKFSADETNWGNTSGYFSLNATADAFYQFSQFSSGWLEQSLNGTTWTLSRYFGTAFNRTKVIDNELYLFGSGAFTKYTKKDLSISDVVTTTSNYGVGATLTVSFVVTNEGTEPTTSGQVGTEVFLSADSFFGNSDDQALGTALVTAPVLQPGESATLQVQAVIPNLIRPGEYRAGLWFNRQGVIQETSSSNNFATSLIQHVRIPGFRLSASSVGNGVVAQDVGQRIFASGSRVSLTATSGKGARFTGWNGDAIGTESQVTILMNQDRNVQANFVSQVNLQLFTRGAGNITGAADEGLYLVGETASLQAVPSAGWIFSGWTGAATGNSTNASILMDQPRYVTASFALPMQTWKALYFTPAELLDPSLSGNDKDIDGDGLENWKEYLHGSNPRDSVSKGILETKAEGGYLTMIFTRLAGTEGTYGLTCQGSRNLSDWDAPDLELRVLDTVNGVETVEARITQNGQPKGFMRFGYQQ